MALSEPRVTGTPARPGPRTAVPEVIAAVDLGSNSFHMIVARYADGRLTVLDRLREMVRLAAGLDVHHRRLSDAASNRALACLERFGQRLRDMHADSVRAVGTNTLRRAEDEQFVQRAEHALGHPIEVISGIEEARLIYLGAAHSLPPVGGRRLVVDIGGGSTELIIGRGLRARRLESLYIGCVGLSERFFADGKLSAKRFERARLEARLELEPIRQSFRRIGWQQAVGTSGTIRSAEEILRQRGSAMPEVTRGGLETLIEELIAAKRVDALALPGLTAERAPVFPGGLAILVEVMAALEIDSLRSADGALREGLLHDLLGRHTDEDVRVQTVRALEQRFHIDTEQADRVEATALALLSQVAGRWELRRPLAARILSWAARLHELGIDIAHAHHQRHGAYLLEHADVAGFPREEQRLLAALVENHRRKLSRRSLKALPSGWRQNACYLIVLLRLAVLLHRGRSANAPPAPVVEAGEQSLRVSFPPGRMDAHPLTRADLAQEAEFLKAIDFELRIA